MAWFSRVRGTPLKRLAVGLHRRASVRAGAETEHICRDLLACQGIDDVLSHYRRYQLHYDVINHLAALNRLAQLDSARAAAGAVLPHALVLERFLAPVISQLAPREIMSYLYVAALYARPVPWATRAMLESALVRQLRAVEALDIAPVWAGPRRGDELGLTRAPQECFAAIRGRGGDAAPQDVANALWAATKAQLSAGPVLSSLWGEMLTVLRSAAGAPTLTFDSLLRVAWAAARLGCDYRGVCDALADALALRSVASPPTFAQRVLLAWAFVTLQHEHHPHVVSLIEGVLDRNALEAARDVLAPSARAQIIQLHSLLLSRPASRAMVSGAGSEGLPAWLLHRPDGDGAGTRFPMEADPQHASALVGMSALLRRMRLKHAMRLIIDGHTIDVAFPKERVGIQVVATTTGTGTLGGAEGRGKSVLPRNDRFHSTVGAMPVRGHEFFGSSSEEFHWQPEAQPEPECVMMAPSPSESLEDSGTATHGFRVASQVVQADPAAMKRAYLTSKGWTLFTVELGTWRHLGETQRGKLLLDLVAAAGGHSPEKIALAERSMRASAL